MNSLNFHLFVISFLFLSIPFPSLSTFSSPTHLTVCLFPPLPFLSFPSSLPIFSSLSSILFLFLYFFLSFSYFHSFYFFGFPLFSIFCSPSLPFPPIFFPSFPNFSLLSCLSLPLTLTFPTLPCVCLFIFVSCLCNFPFLSLCPLTFPYLLPLPSLTTYLCSCLFVLPSSTAIVLPS